MILKDIFGDGTDSMETEKISPINLKVCTENSQ